MLQKTKKNTPPELPTKKMPTARAILLFGIALCFSILIFMFSIFPVTAPIMIGVSTASYVENVTESKTLGNIAGYLAATFTGIFEVTSGIGVEALSFIGEIIADALTFFGWIIIYFLLILYGIPFISTGSASNKRFAIATLAFIIGLIPFLNIIPTLLTGVTLIILNVRREDHIKYAAYKEQLEKYYALRKEALAHNMDLQQILSVNNTARE